MINKRFEIAKQLAYDVNKGMLKDSVLIDWLMKDMKAERIGPRMSE